MKRVNIITWESVIISIDSVKIYQILQPEFAEYDQENTTAIFFPGLLEA